MYTRLIILGAVAVLATAALTVVALGGGETADVETGESVVAGSAVQTPVGVGEPGDGDVALTWKWPDIERTDARLGKVVSVASDEGGAPGGTVIPERLEDAATVDVAADAVVVEATAVAVSMWQAEVLAIEDVGAPQVVQEAVVSNTTDQETPTPEPTPTPWFSGPFVCNTPWGTFPGSCDVYISSPQSDEDDSDVE